MNQEKEDEVQRFIKSLEETQVRLSTKETLEASIRHTESIIKGVASKVCYSKGDQNEEKTVVVVSDAVYDMLLNPETRVVV